MIACRTAFAAVLAGLVHASPALPADPAPAGGPALEQAAALRASQAVLGSQPGDYTLLDREGRPVRLADYRGKPLLVSFIYTGCFTVCPTSTRMLNEAVTALQDRFGTGQFNVVSIGFNQPADSPQALKAFAAQNRISLPNWEFLSPHPSIVAALTRDFGFSYVATAAGFDHLLQLTILDGEGRIVRQVYGDRLGASQLGEPLKQLLAGAPLPQDARLSDLIDRVRILCSVYDPVTGAYRVDYGLAIMVAGGVTFALAMAWFFLLEWRTQRQARRRQSAHGSSRFPA
ncbi:MAG: SCO family protein [Proteobacteria bacterium]|nr:SCO family protein [Pseudomonadota bacterium]